MGSDDLFKKRRQGRQKRKYEQRIPRANSYLIVTEGERTEPLYFQGIADRIKIKVGGNVTVYEMPFIDINGEGCSTNKLIEKTEEIVNKSKIIYENVWVVFDEDDFNDFDEAIIRAEEKGYQVAWSNQSFEYWLYLHFCYSDSALHRHTWNEKLSEIFKDREIANGKYMKNNVEIFDIVYADGGLDLAIKYSKRRMSEFNKEKDSPSKYDPGNTVYKLAMELKRYLDE